MSEAASITVRVPLAIRRRPGRKTVASPEGAASPAPARPTRPGQGAGAGIAGNACWTRGRYASISEIAAAEKLDRGYLGRVLG
jgi:hypothetical protein